MDSPVAPQGLTWSRVGMWGMLQLLLCFYPPFIPQIPPPGLKTCVSSGNSDGTPMASSGQKHLHVPSIIVTPPTPTGTTLSREGRAREGPSPCSQC